jgi:para-aminobenzoate synthetase component 1
MLNRKEAIKKMNQYGKEKRPFFFMVDFLQQKPIVLSLDEIDTDTIQFSIPILSIQKEKIHATDSVFISHKGYSQELYNTQIERVKQHIRQGNSFLTNLTCETPIYLDKSLEEVYFIAQAKYKLWYKNKFVVFSPETFVTIKNAEIASCPMKGTIDATFPNAREIILQNPKEKAEHYTIVDLIRNDLSMVAKDVKVSNFRYIDEIISDTGKLLQVSSKITGTLAANYLTQLGTILFKLLPAGSISGAPKNKTVEIIRETETYNRGYYTGIFGVFDGEILDSAVMIRFIEKKAEGFVYKSGGGITAFSEAESEYNEMLNKIYVPTNRKY